MEFPEKKEDRYTENSPKEKHPVWHCDTYCRKIRHAYCEGRQFADSAEPELCPYYDEMLY